MAFADLALNTQNILMVQFEFFGKIFLIGFFFIIASLYLLHFKRKEDTPYLLVALIRTWLWALSWIYIYFTPLFIVWVYPQVPIDTILKFVFWLYRYATLLIGLTIFFNLLFYGPLILAKISGLYIPSENTNKILKAWLGKNYKYFKR